MCQEQVGVGSVGIFEKPNGDCPLRCNQQVDVTLELDSLSISEGTETSWQHLILRCKEDLLL